MLGDRLFLVGGIDKDGKYFESVMPFNLSMNAHFSLSYLFFLFLLAKQQWGKPLGGFEDFKRNFFSCVTYDDKIWVFGGKGNGYRNDLIVYEAGITANYFPSVFNASQGKWQEVDGDGKNVPPRRYGHTAVVYKRRMYVFGGYDTDGFTLNDLCSYSFSII